MLCFQLGVLATLMPSTKQPPGQRTKAGRRSAIYFARSFRRPFFRSLNVLVGNSDTTSSHTVPAPPNEITKRALGSVFVAVNVVTYFFHSLLVQLGNVYVASTVPLADCKE